MDQKTDSPHRFTWIAVKQALSGALGLVLAASFIVSGAAMSVLASTGGRIPDSAKAWLLLAGALLATATLALGPLVTIGRRQWLAAVCLAPLWGMCAGFTLQSIVKFASENLLDQAAVRSRDAAAYATASGQVAALERRRAAITEMRGAEEIARAEAAELAKPVAAGGTVESRTRACTVDLDRAPVACQRVAEIRLALAQARDRDDLDRQITEAASRRDALSPVAADAVGRMLGVPAGAVPDAGMAGAVRRLTGLDIRTAEEARAVTMALIVWLGELLMPVIVSLAGRGWPPQRTPARAGPSPAIAAPLADVDLVSAVTAWAADRVERIAGGHVPAGALYDDFCAWCARQRRSAPSAYLFGLVLTNDLKWAKRKQGKKSLVCYQGLHLKGGTIVAAPRVDATGGLVLVTGGRAP